MQKEEAPFFAAILQHCCKKDAGSAFFLFTALNPRHASVLTEEKEGDV